MKPTALLIMLLFLLLCEFSGNKYNPDDPSYEAPSFTVDAKKSNVKYGDTVGYDTVRLVLYGNDEAHRNLFRWALDGYSWSKWGGEGETEYVISLTKLSIGKHVIKMEICYNPEEEVTDSMITFYWWVMDIDKNKYNPVEIGTQTWLDENLKTTRLNDGTSIPYRNTQNSPGYWWYNNDSENKKYYGALYNWYAVNTGKLAPKGWHIPSNAEWMELEKFLSAKYGTKVGKSLAETTGWSLSTSEGAVGNDQSTNNKTNFSARPGGYYKSDVGQFLCILDQGVWWSATGSNSEAYFYWLWFDWNYISHLSNPKSYGFSVRCIRD